MANGYDNPMMDQQEDDNDDDVIGKDDFTIDDLAALLKKLEQTYRGEAGEGTEETQIILERVAAQKEEFSGPAGIDEGTHNKMKLASLEALSELDDVGEIFRAILDEDLDPAEREIKASESLINYFAKLGQSDMDIDFDLLKALTAWADLGKTDIHGQSVMHEIAREWDTSLANWLVSQGAPIDKPDQWGRTPLFVAASANHTAMVRYLVKNRADIHKATMEGQGQQPIHFAAKYNAVDSFDVLVELGADPIARDHQGRTPFFVAANAGNYRMCKHMLDIGLPTVSYSVNGESTIDQILNKLPNDIGCEALDQFQCPSSIAGKLKIYLSCLGKRRWRLLTKEKDNKSASKTDPNGPLEVITNRQDMQLITHPVILLYLNEARQQFSLKYIRLNCFLYLLYTLLWTLAVTLFKYNQNWYSSAGIVVLTVAAQLLTFAFIYKFYRQHTLQYRAKVAERDRILRQCSHEEKFSHPRWTKDAAQITKDREVASNLTYNVFADQWNIIEVLCLFMACVQTLLTFAWVGTCGQQCVLDGGVEYAEAYDLRAVRNYWSIVFLLVTWIRLNICFRYHQTFGPLISVLAGCVDAVVQIGFLFFEFFIPFVVASWLLFGGRMNGGDNGDEETEFSKIHNMIYQIYLLTIVGDYEFDEFVRTVPWLGEIMVGYYALTVSIITINLYIGLLSELYATIAASASAKAYLEEAKMMKLCQLFWTDTKHKFDMHINKECAPMIIDSKLINMAKAESAKKIVMDAKNSVSGISVVLNKVVQEQEEMIKGVDKMTDDVKKFSDKHTTEWQTSTLNGFEALRKNEMNTIVKATKATNERIVYFINLLQEKVSGDNV